MIATLAGVLCVVPSMLRGEGGVGWGSWPQLSNHIHHVRHDHLTGTHGFKALGQRAIWILLYVQVRLYGHRPPTTCRVNSDLLKLRTKEGGGKKTQWVMRALKVCTGLNTGCIQKSYVTVRLNSLWEFKKDLNALLIVVLTRTYFWMALRIPHMYWSTSRPSSNAVLLQTKRAV